MSEVSREEFGALTERVNDIEAKYRAATDVFSSEFVGLRIDLREHMGSVNGRLDGIDSRLDRIDGRLDGLRGQVEDLDQALSGVQTDVRGHTSMLRDILRKLDER